MLESEKTSHETITFACISDSRYLIYLKIFLKSLVLSKNNIHVSVCLINIKHKSKTVKNLRNIYSNMTIDFLDKKFKKKYFLKAFCANQRAELICSLLEKNFHSVIYIDVDSIVRKKIPPIENILKNDDIKIFKRVGNDVRFKVAARVIFIKNNTNSKRFIKTWKNALDKKKLEWFADQITFHETYQKLNDQISLGMLPSIYIDWQFKKDSIIWAGKGPRKKRNLLYLLESLKIVLNRPTVNWIINKIQIQIYKFNL